MELWQKEGFSSYRDWRLAAETARRAAKRKAATAASDALPSPPVKSAALPAADLTGDDLLWQAPELIEPPSAPNSPLQLKQSAGHLPGKLQEHVQVTPGGHRVHTMKHTSPSGTTRLEERVSPAGSRQTSRAERCAWRHRVAAERRIERTAREATARQIAAEKRALVVTKQNLALLLTGHCW